MNKKELKSRHGIEVSIDNCMLNGINYPFPKTEVKKIELDSMFKGEPYLIVREVNLPIGKLKKVWQLSGAALEHEYVGYSIDGVF